MYNQKSIYEVIEYLYKQDKKDLAERVIKMLEAMKVLEGQLYQLDTLSTVANTGVLDP